MKLRVLVTALLLVASAVASAHQQSQSFLRLTQSADPNVEVRLDLALVDLEHAIGLDDNADAQISWGELRAHEADIRRYVEARLQVHAADPKAQPCALRFKELRVDTHADGTYAVFNYAGICPATIAIGSAAVGVNYSLFFDLDSAHRALIDLTRADGSQQSGVLSTDSRTLEFAANAAQPPGWRDSAQWVSQGMWHIWTGFDHLLFLLTLLLPAVVRRERGGGWVAQPSLRAALLDIVRVVTAFTVAHSLTLLLATLGVLHFQTRWVESAIALTVLLGALNILFPVVHERRWVLALTFGLVHGLGFAAALGDLGLHGTHLVRNLLLFNLGVEMGQLAIVAVFIPAAFALRDRHWYRVVATPVAAAAVGLQATCWLAQRVMA